MSPSDHEQAAPARAPSPPPLSWPPPGLERLQGKLWRAIALTWMGSLVLVMPLLWALASEQPFWSLGPFEGNWRVGMAIASLGLVFFTVGFATLFSLLRDAAAAADSGYGTLTILEVASDVGRDTGFLIQGRGHFSQLDTDYRARIAGARLQGGGLVLGSAIWLALGFGFSVLLAARGFVTPSGIWLMTVGPTLLLLATGFGVLLVQNLRVRSARQAWAGQEGADRVAHEAEAWARRLDDAGDAIALGSGPKGESARFRLWQAGVAVAFLAALVPTATVAVTAAIGPILADIAVPQFLSVQEMAGAAEVLRRYRVEGDTAGTSSRTRSPRRWPGT